MAVKKIARIDAIYPKTLSLTWIINNICSNSCSYCIPALYAGTNHNYEWANAKKFIQELFDKYESIHCNVSGGEPTMSPFFEELAQMFYESGNTIGMTTNGVRTERYYKDISKYMLYSVFSYHPEYGDNNNLIEKCKVMKDNTRCHITVMMHPKYWDQCVEYYNRVCEIPYIGAVATRINDRQQEDKSTAVYTDEQIEWFKDNGGVKNVWGDRYKGRYKKEKTGMVVTHTDGTVSIDPVTNVYMADGQINFKGWKCHVGLEAMYISTAGTVYGSNCAINGPLGHINEPDKVKINTEPVICDGRRCDCSPDYKITKYPA